MSRRILLSAAFSVTLVAGCGGLNLLGGRQPCWSEAESRSATLMRGQLVLDLASGSGTLRTPDGTDFPTRFPFMTVDSIGDTVVLKDEGKTIALNGEVVTVFGGLGSDGNLLVCSIELESD